MNFKEIIGAIQKDGISVEDFAHGDFVAPKEVGEFFKIKQQGGEGQGDYWFSILFFKEHDVYVKTEGDYSSYDGVDFYNDFGSCTEVRPQQKTITVYE